MRLTWHPSNQMARVGDKKIVGMNNLSNIPHSVRPEENHAIEYFKQLISMTGGKQYVEMCINQP